MLSHRNEIIKKGSIEIPSLNSVDISYSNNTNLKYPITPSIEEQPNYLDKEELNGNTNSDNIKATEIKEEVKEEHYVEIYEGGSLIRLKKEVIDPFENHTDIPKSRGDRKNITYFTKRSRSNFLDQLSMINQNKIPQDKVLFLTLTLDPKVSVNTDCKRFLNNFLTQLRSRLSGLKWFYCWKLEFQKKTKMVHFHVCIFGLKHLNHNWIRHTWSRITLGDVEYNKRCRSSNNQKEVWKRLVITHIEKSRGWGRTQQYFSKTLGYVSKNEEEEKETIRRYLKISKPVGRFWGIGKRDVYKSFVNRITFKLTEGEFYKLRRVFLGCMKSRWIRKFGSEFDYKKWKRFERFNKSRGGKLDYVVSHGTSNIKYTTTLNMDRCQLELKLFLSNDMLKKLFSCLFNISDIFDTDTRVLRFDRSKFVPLRERELLKKVS